MHTAEQVALHCLLATHYQPQVALHASGREHLYLRHRAGFVKYVLLHPLKHGHTKGSRATPSYLVVLLATHCSPPTPYCLLLTTYYLLLTSYFLLLTSYFLLLTSDFLLLYF